MAGLILLLLWGAPAMAEVIFSDDFASGDGGTPTTLD